MIEEFVCRNLRSTHHLTCAGARIECGARTMLSRAEFVVLRSAFSNGQSYDTSDWSRQAVISCQGSMSEIPISMKSLMLRVARAAA